MEALRADSIQPPQDLRGSAGPESRLLVGWGFPKIHITGRVACQPPCFRRRIGHSGAAGRAGPKGVRLRDPYLSRFTACGDSMILAWNAYIFAIRSRAVSSYRAARAPPRPRARAPGAHTPTRPHAHSHCPEPPAARGGRRGLAAGASAPGRGPARGAAAARGARGATPARETRRETKPASQPVRYRTHLTRRPTQARSAYTLHSSTRRWLTWATRYDITRPGEAKGAALGFISG